MPDPVSWLVIEPGWEVIAADGDRVGDVREVAGDSGNDIFNGLVVSTGLLRTARYVPSEVVETIYEGRIELSIDHSAFDRLEDHEEPPPSEQFRAP